MHNTLDIKQNAPLLLSNISYQRQQGQLDGEDANKLNLKFTLGLSGFFFF